MQILIHKFIENFQIYILDQPKNINLLSLKLQEKALEDKFI